MEDKTGAAPKHGRSVPPSLQAVTRAWRESRDLTLSDGERAALESLLRGCKPNSTVARRVQIVLACSEPGATEAAVAAALGTSITSVVTWRTLFHQRRLAALPVSAQPKARCRAQDSDAVDRVLRLTRETRSPDGRPWSTRSMAKAAGLSHVRVWQIWRDQGIVPQSGARTTAGSGGN